MSDNCECPFFKHAITINTRGGVRPCCVFDNSKLATIKLDQVDRWKTIFHDLDKRSKNEWLPECAGCKTLEDAGLPSMRNTDSAWRPSGPDADSVGVVYWDFKINNTCNLACRMCNGASSSKWEQLANTLDGLDKYHQTTLPDRWHKGLDSVLPLLIDARVVKFTGGEPFMIPQVFRVVDYLIDEDIAPAVNLTFVTNGTQDHEKYYEKFKKFKKVRLNISIDAVGKRFEYIRSGADWEQVKNNMERLSKNRPANTEVSFLITPGLLNENYLNEPIELAKSLGFMYNINVPISHPQWLASGALKDAKTRMQFEKQMSILDKHYGTDYRDFIDENQY